MSTTLSQLVLDIIVFSITYYIILPPLMQRALEYSYGQPITPLRFTAKFDSIKNWIRNQLRDDYEIQDWIKQQVQKNRDAESKAATASTHLTAPTEVEPTECDRCCGLFEDESSILRWCCGCTWCAECVESSFETAINEGDKAADKPLRALSKRCPFAQKHTIREMLPRSEAVLSEGFYRHIQRMIMEQDTLASINMEKNDWMLEADEDEEVVKRRSLLDFSPIKRESW